MDKILKLDNLCKSLISEGGIFGKNGFFDKNKYIILISFLAGIFANLTDITNPTYGFDAIDAISNDYFQTFLYMNMRVMAAILYKLLPALSLHGISQIVGLLVLSISAALIVYKLNISYVAKAIFSVLFVAHPIWSHLTFFHHQFAYNTFGVLAVTLSFLLILWQGVDRKTAILRFIFAIILLLFALFSYQSLLFFFAMLGSFYAMLTYSEKENFKYSFKLLITTFIVCVISFIIYLILIKLCFGGFNSYQTGFTKDASSLKAIIKYIEEGITGAYRLLISHRQFSGMNGGVAFILLFLFFFITIFRLRELKDILKFLLFFLSFFLTCIVFEVFFDSASWSHFEIPLYFAISCLLGYLLFKNIVWKAFLLLSFSVVLFSNMQHISINQQSQIVMIENEKIVVQRITDIIYDKAPEVYEGKKKIILVGFPLYRDKHPLVEKSVWFYKHSIFETDQAGLFFKLYGLPNNVSIINSYGFEFVTLNYYSYNIESKDKEIHRQAVDIAKSMPAYPDRDCVKVEEDYIIVKFGNED